MSQIRVKISSDNIPETVITPVWDSEFTHKIEKDRIYYLHEMKGSPTLKGADFTLVNDLADDCEEITFLVERLCEDVWSEYWTGVFTKFDCKFDYFKCSLKAKVKPNTTYECVFRGWDDEENVYAGTGPDIQVKSLGGTYQVDVHWCTDCRPTPDPSPCDTYTDSCIEPGYPIVIAWPDATCTDPDDYEVQTMWHRETGLGTPTVPPPWASGWTLLSGSTWWRCPSAGDLAIGVLRYGRRFDAVIEHLVSQLGCGITVRSHFFSLNATHDAPPSNDAYDFATEFLTDLTVHQKSDVKRPDGDRSFSFVWKMKLKTLLADLQVMYNVFWELDGTDLILEHISYFEAVAGADYSSVKMPLEIEYDINTPEKERFLWSDEDCSDHFKGEPITYNCGNGEAERRVSLFDTDVEFVRTEAYQDRISDANFVMISNLQVGGSYYISASGNC